MIAPPKHTTYDNLVAQVDLRHIDEARGTNVVELGVDLSEFYTSVEWDILEVPAIRYAQYAPILNLFHLQHLIMKKSP